MKLIPIILISMLLAGCTVPVNFYLRNTATKVVEIRARYIGKKDQDIALKYKESLLDINYDLFKTFDKDLLPKESKNSYLTFALPPHATFFIGRGLNFDNFVFDDLADRLFVRIVFDIDYDRFDDGMLIFVFFQIFDLVQQFVFFPA